MNLVRVMSKPTKRAGKVYPASPTKYSVNMTGCSKNGFNGVTIFRDDTQANYAEMGSSFDVGDTAEYDSFNLSYCGVITQITEKSVTIVAYPGSRNAVKHRLNLEQFCWRNFKFNAVETSKRNSEEMMYL
jgi:hypothetical protein